MLVGDVEDLPLTYEAFAAAGSGLGAAGFWVLDDTADMAAVAEAVAWFLHVESCGQCSPCKIGTGSISQVLHRVRTGMSLGSDAGALARALATVSDGARCHLPTQARDVVSSILASFPDDFARPDSRSPVLVEVPKLVDLADGVAIVDERQARKRPDWTYGDVPVRIGEPRPIPT